MKRLTKPYKQHRWQSEVDRLILVSNSHGYELSNEDAIWAWEEFSDINAASWLDMDCYLEDELWEILKFRLHEVEE